FPEHFNGILAGARANNWSHLFTAFVWNERALLATPDSPIPPAKLPVIQRAVMAACDRLDGVADGLINNPRACTFDPAVLLCKGADAESCLTAPQLESVKRAYATAKTKSGEAVFPGKERGSETGWGGVLAGAAAPGGSVGG